MPAIRAAGAVTAERYRVFDYHTGDVLATRPGMDKDGRKWMEEAFGYCHHFIHRVDYQRILVAEARRLRVDIRLGAEVREVKCYETGPFVQLSNGEKVCGDVIVGADGIMSRVRTDILGCVRQPQPTGDLAYRATIPRAQVEALLGSFPRLNGILHANEQWTWWGPNSHIMFYPIKDCQIFNMVLLCPDDLPENVRRADADIDQMRGLFKDWDPLLQSLVAQVSSVLKWKLQHMEELKFWTKGSAMAAEDGLCLGTLLGLLYSKRQRSQAGGASSSDGTKDGAYEFPLFHPTVPEVLGLYESLRKQRTTINIRVALDNRSLYHMVDPSTIAERNEWLKGLNWEPPENEHEISANLKPKGKCWKWGHMRYQTDLLGWDTHAEAVREFERHFEKV
ncbi:MAG: hypothetical protein Q9157_002422 [Trypethelium eluteriae]